MSIQAANDPDKRSGASDMERVLTTLAAMVEGDRALNIDGAALLLGVPEMLAETDEASQMDAFAGRADLITDAAGPEDQDHVWGRLQHILADNCMVPADEGPCS